MIELLLCSLFTDPAGLSCPPVCARQEARPRDHPLLGLVRAPLRHHRLSVPHDLLFTLILYFHPSTSNAISFYRTVPILPEGCGRVDEVYVELRDKVKAGQPIFKLDSSEQEAAMETARRRITEIDAAIRACQVPAGGLRRPDTRGRERLPPGG